MAFIQTRPGKKFSPKTSGACSNRLLARYNPRPKTEFSVIRASGRCTWNAKPAQPCSCHSERSEESEIVSLRAFKRRKSEMFRFAQLDRAEEAAALPLSQVK